MAGMTFKTKAKLTLCLIGIFACVVSVYFPVMTHKAPVEANEKVLETAKGIVGVANTISVMRGSDLQIEIEETLITSTDIEGVDLVLCREGENMCLRTTTALLPVMCGATYNRHCKPDDAQESWYPYGHYWNGCFEIYWAGTEPYAQAAYNSCDIDYLKSKGRFVK